MSAEVVDLHAEDPRLEAEGLRAALEAERARARKHEDALNAMVALAAEMMGALPNDALLKRNVVLGSLLTLSGLAETALEG